MSYEDIVTADRRLAILQSLHGMTGNTANDVVLLGMLSQQGHRIGRDRLRTDLAWLEEQGLIVGQQPGGIWIATLSARGYDVAEGTAHAPGVAHPRPA